MRVTGTEAAAGRTVTKVEARSPKSTSAKKPVKSGKSTRTGTR